MTDTRISRRAFLLGGAGAAATAGAATLSLRDTADIPPTLAIPENAVSLPRNGKSVLLIGGGLSGLITGCELIDRGFEVTLLEKNATLGGRLRAWRDADFGYPSKAAAWHGHPIEHGTHIIFNFYRNFRDMLARRGLSVRQRPINYPMPAISFAYPSGVIDDRAPSRLPAPYHAAPLLSGLKYVSKEADRALMGVNPLHMLGLDLKKPEVVAYLDSVSISEWARRTKIPGEVVHAVMDPLMDMGNFLTADKTSALYLFRMLDSMWGHWRDMYGVQFFQDSTDETIIQPLADYFVKNGGRIVFNAELDRFESLGERITRVRTKSISGEQYICPICGEVHDRMPARCRRCSYGGDGFKRTPQPAQTFTADYYLLGVDIPNAQRILSESPFKEKNLYPTVGKLTTSSIVVVYIWYPRAKPNGQKTNWEDHFGDRECLMVTDFPYLGTTLNLSYLKKQSFGEFDADVIETQIAHLDRIEGMSDVEIARHVSDDLRALMPGLPDFDDVRVIRWDNFTASTPGIEAHRPSMRTPFKNFLLLGDWIELDHNCFLMEKVTVNAKRAVNYLLDDIGQQEGKMTIAPTGTPSLSLDLHRLIAPTKLS